MGAQDLLRELTDAGLLIAVDGSDLIVKPRSLLTDDIRSALRCAKPEILALLSAIRPATQAAGWSDADIGRFIARRDRLMRWGWSEADAEVFAERLTRRDQEGDDRVSCAGDCANYRPGRCANHRLAGLHSAVVGRDLATMLQRCPGFKP